MNSAMRIDTSMERKLELRVSSLSCRSIKKLLATPFSTSSYTAYSNPP